MNIFILTIHNPNISLGPTVRLQGFLNSEEFQNLNIYMLPFRRDKRFIKFNTIKNLIKSLYYIIKNRKKIDLIHVVTPPSYTAPIAKFAKKFLKIPYIVDIGDPYAENMAELHNYSKNSLRFKILKKLDNSLYKKADHLVLSSDGLTKYLPKNISKNVPQTTILTGICSEKDISIQENYKHPINKRCLFLGQYGPLQNFEYILEVFNVAIKKDKEITLDVIGVGDNKNCKNKNIKFFGLIPQEQIPAKIKEYSCGIVSLKLSPNLDYAVPTKLLNYLSFGLPVFGTGGESSRKLIKNNKTGYISTKYDVEKDAEILIELLNDSKKLEDLSKNAINFAKKHLTFESAGRQLLEIYKSLP